MANVTLNAEYFRSLHIVDFIFITGDLFTELHRSPVSMKHGLRTTDCGLGIKYGLGIKRGLRTEYKTWTRYKMRTTD